MTTSRRLGSVANMQSDSRHNGRGGYCHIQDDDDPGHHVYGHASDFVIKDDFDVKLHTGDMVCYL
jgi:hypothetical protein